MGCDDTQYKIALVNCLPIPISFTLEIRSSELNNVSVIYGETPFSISSSFWSIANFCSDKGPAEFYFKNIANFQPSYLDSPQVFHINPNTHDEIFLKSMSDIGNYYSSGNWIIVLFGVNRDHNHTSDYFISTKGIEDFVGYFNKDFANGFYSGQMNPLRFNKYLNVYDLINDVKATLNVPQGMDFLNFFIGVPIQPIGDYTNIAIRDCISNQYPAFANLPVAPLSSKKPAQNQLTENTIKYIEF